MNMEGKPSVYVGMSADLHELRRILRPGGALVIIDKNLDRLPYWPGGIPPWEQWFDADKLAAMLSDMGGVYSAGTPGAL